MPTLSVLIPARNEAWLNRTVADVLEHSGPETEVIVVLDGQWPAEPLPADPRVQVVFVPASIGQRAATNLAASVSEAEFICKLDAHCSVAPGWDTALIASARELGPHVVQVPAQHNLHVFDWVCQGCQRRTYQGPTPTQACPQCQSTDYAKDIIWKPRRGVRTTAWRFDGDLKFQYWGEFTRRPEGQGEITETMSCLGACWFLRRDWFWALGGLDEAHGSWGQMGTEIACKAWLSGGRMVCNQRTWFAHLFRTQGGDFGFPYPLSGAEVSRARSYSQRLWKHDGWPGAVRPLSWLIDHFAPVPDWDQAPAVRVTPTKGLVYYSDNRPDPAILDACRRTIEASGLPIVAVTLAPVRWPAARSIVLDAQRGYLTMFRQILAGLEALETEVAFLVEHDVLYHRSHFDFVPPTADCYYYNLHVWKLHAETGQAVHYQTKQTSGLVADRQLLIRHYRERIRRVEAEGFSRRMGFEPGSHGRAERVDDVPSETFWSAQPNIDLRHGANLTSSRWHPSEFRDQRNCRGWTEADVIPGWGPTGDILARWRTQEAVA